MSPTNDMKARLFVDMDGTLAVWKQAACFEDLLQPGYFRDLPPYQTVLDAVKILCNTKPELDVYALSAYMPENPYAVHEKNAWLDAYLPEIDSEHRIFVACGSSKARAAANRLKTPCIDNSFMLLDDYSVNLHEWKANRGSCIKLRNGINGNGGTWKGESVTRFDTAENIADRIWSIQMCCIGVPGVVVVGNSLFPDTELSPTDFWFTHKYFALDEKALENTYQQTKE